MLTKKLRKIISVLCTATMLMSGMVCSVHADSEATVTDSNILYYEDFEELTTENLAAEGFTMSETVIASGGTKDELYSEKVETDPVNSKALRVENGSVNIIQLTKSFEDIKDKIPTTGTIELSYDVYFENRTRYFFTFGALNVYDNGYSSYENNFTNYNRTENLRYVANETYVSFKKVIDLNNGTTTDYIADSYHHEYNHKLDNSLTLKFDMRKSAHNYNYKCTCASATDDHTEGCPIITPLVFWIDNITVKKVDQELVKTTPVDGAEVTTDKAISAEYAIPVVSANVTTDYITVTENGTPLEADAYTVAASTDYKTVNVTVTGGLKAGTTYEVTIKKEVTGLSKDTTFSFSTLDNNVLYYEDFENATEGDAGSTLGYNISSDGSNTSATVQTDSRGSKALKLVNGSAKAISVYKRFDSISIPASGKVELSFDVYFENRARKFAQFAFLGSLIENCYVSSINSNSFSTYSSAYPKYTYTMNNEQYYTHRYVIDVDNGEMHKYINGDYIGNLPWKGLTILQFHMDQVSCNSNACTTDTETGVTTHGGTCPLAKSQVFWLDNITVKVLERDQAVVKTIPGNNTSVSIGSAISAKFKESVYSKLATTDNITVTENGTPLAETEYTVKFPNKENNQYIYDYSTVNINVTDGLKAGTTYEVTIKAAVTGLSEDYTFSFKTLGNNVLYYEDFEGANAGDSGSDYGFTITADGTNTSATVENHTTESTKALKVVNGSELTIDFKKDLSKVSYPTTGTIEVSFDAYFENRTRNFYVFGAVGNNNYGYSSPYKHGFSNYDQVAMEQRDVIDGKYYNFKIIIDLDNKTYTKYLDGKIISRKAHNGNVPTFINTQMRAAKNDPTQGSANLYACTCTDADTDGNIDHKNCPKVTPQVFWIDNLKVEIPEIATSVTDSEGNYISTVVDYLHNYVGNHLNAYKGQKVKVNTGIAKENAEGKTVIITVNAVTKVTKPDNTYSDEAGKLVDVYTITTDELKAGTNYKEITLPSSEDENYKIEIYLWDSFNGMKPLYAHKLIER